MKKNMYSCLHVKAIAVCFVLVLPLALCYRTGAPASACTTLTPTHDISSQPESTFPYMIDVEVFRDPYSDQLLYTPGFSYNSKTPYYSHLLANTYIYRPRVNGYYYTSFTLC